MKTNWKTWAKAGVYRHRDTGVGRRELAGGALRRRVRVCDGGFAGADRAAGSWRKVNTEKTPGRELILARVFVLKC